MSEKDERLSALLDNALDRKELNEFCDGQRGSVNCVSYDERDGMISRECNGGTQPAGMRDRDGRLWFPTIKGAVVIDPDNVKPNLLPPPVVIEKISAARNKMRRLLFIVFSFF